MAMIERLEVEGFRCFQRLHVDGLSRVNLIVGGNNSGKTALLEAIEAVASREPYSFYRSSHERGEAFAKTLEDGRRGLVIEVRRWFFGHPRAEASLAIRALGPHPLELTRRLERIPETVAKEPPFRFGEWQLVELAGEKVVVVLPVRPDGLLGAPQRDLFPFMGLRRKPPLFFIPTSPFRRGTLAPLWDAILLTATEESVQEAMRLVDPRVSRVAPSAGEVPRGELVLLEGTSEPVPLSSLGEGSGRALALALALANTSGGILLIDEIESGLHWSVMPKIWKFLVHTAQKLDVQVFAATHSKDCIEAIGQLHRDHPELAADVSVHRLEVGRPEPVRYSAYEVNLLLDTTVEVR